MTLKDLDKIIDNISDADLREICETRPAHLSSLEYNMFVIEARDRGFTQGA